ncbi:MAG: DNA polymerase III subunit gamma/tau, partial [Hyphomicrobiales bacterium]|nr:DNA polymerase III subunit gamma/tau [Hyphomicrobiales bacterium]
MADNSAQGKTKTAAAPPYLALARKYRPQHFGDLVGQDAMVRTLQNAFRSGRVAHAFLLTGVRGVGKTTTARILARALNYVPPAGDARPLAELDFTQSLPKGALCDEILQGRQADVMELDAASHGGIDDMRALIEQARYRPMAARCKVYIIDEVHMLSTEAFNGLLKILEEPPPHVKFIFATTEIRKVPVTILSRCQRFDLRRLSHKEIEGLLGRVCVQEKVELAPEILALVARAADGSARDGLSLLDRLMARAAEAQAVSLEEVRQALGLADRARIFDLLEHVLKGDTKAALAELQEQYRLGADAAGVLAELAELTHWLGRLKFVADTDMVLSLSEEQTARARVMAEAISVPALARLWQVLLKAHQEVAGAALPLAAADMAMIRLTHITTQPTPDVLLRKLAPDMMKAQDTPAAAPAAGEKQEKNPPAGEDAKTGDSPSTKSPTAGPPTAGAAGAEDSKAEDSKADAGEDAKTGEKPSAKSPTAGAPTAGAEDSKAEDSKADAGEDAKTGDSPSDKSPTAGAPTAGAAGEGAATDDKPSAKLPTAGAEAEAGEKQEKKLPAGEDAKTGDSPSDKSPTAGAPPAGAPTAGGGELLRQAQSLFPRAELVSQTAV